MMTILLAFFILLNQMAQVRDYGLLGAGLGMFRMSFVASGLPGFLTGATNAGQLITPAGKYRPENGETSEDEDQGVDYDGRLIAVDGKDLKDSLQKAVKTREPVVLPLAITYGRELSDEAKRQLAILARTARGGDDKLMIQATVADSAVRRPWSAASAWALQVGRYLCDTEGIPHHRVIVVGRVRRAGDDAEGARKTEASIGAIVIPGSTRKGGAGMEEESYMLDREKTVQHGIVSGSEE